jgi:hypothetical protein
MCSLDGRSLGLNLSLPWRIFPAIREGVEEGRGNCEHAGGDAENDEEGGVTHYAFSNARSGFVAG